MQPLRCRSAREVLILLKSSDFIRDDLAKVQELDFVPYLSLVRYHDLEPKWELRVFVHEKQVKGICQRNTNDKYPELEEHKLQITQRVSAFYHEKVKDVFPLDSFCMDVYAQPSKTYIVGMSPWRGDTESLLFEWDEVEGNCEAVLKTIDEASLRPSPFHNFRFPVDMMFSENIEQFIEELKKKHEVQPTAENPTT